MECLINGYVPTELMIGGQVINGCAKGGEVVYRKKNAGYITNYGDDFITTKDTVYAQIKNLNIYGKTQQDQYYIQTVEDSVVQFDDGVGEYAVVTSDVDCTLTRCGKNLLNLSISEEPMWLLGGTTTVFNNTISYDIPLSSGAYTYWKSLDEFIPKGTYRISYDWEGVHTNSDNISMKLEFKNSSGVIIASPRNWSNNSGETFTLKEDCTAIRIVPQSFIGGNSYVGSFSNFQVELGSTATDYEPYTGETYTLTANTPTQIPLLDGINTFFCDSGDNLTVRYLTETETDETTPNVDFPQEMSSVEGDLVVTSCGKNLYPNTFDDSVEWYSTSSLWYSLNKQGGFYSTGSYKASATKFLCKAGVQYYLDIRNSDCINIVATGFRVCETDADVPNPCIYDTDTYIVPRYKTGSNDTKTLTVLANPIITIDSNTDYEPYTGSAATLTLTESLKGIETSTNYNYTDSDGQTWLNDVLDVQNSEIKKNLAEIVFDGTENWEATSDSFIRMHYTLGAKPVTDNNTIAPLFCNLYHNKTANQTYLGEEGVSIDNSGNLRIYSADFTDVTSWKAYLAGLYANNTPLRIIYQLNTPTTEQIDTTSLKKLRSYVGQTNLFVSDNAGLKADFRMDLGDKVIKGYILDYIESTGTQWIDTGIYPYSNWKIKTIDKTASGQKWASFWGWWAGYDQSTKWGFATHPPYYYLMSDNLDYATNIISETIGNKAYKQYDNGTFTENEQIIKIIQNTNNLISLKPLLIFNSYNRSGGFDYNLATKLYTFLVENKEQENIFTGVPYQTLGGTNCMYDTVTNTTFENQGTGDFLGGEIIGYITEDNIAYNNDGTLYDPDITTAVMSSGVEPAETQTLQLAQLEELGVTI